jgi:hypothetical protein
VAYCRPLALLLRLADATASPGAPRLARNPHYAILWVLIIDTWYQSLVLILSRARRQSSFFHTETDRFHPIF